MEQVEKQLPNSVPVSSKWCATQKSPILSMAVGAMINVHYPLYSPLWKSREDLTQEMAEFRKFKRIGSLRTVFEKYFDKRDDVKLCIFLYASLFPSLDLRSQRYFTLIAVS